MSFKLLAEAIEASQFGTFMRESIYWFPALTLAHVCGLLIAAGTIVFWDLRLLGFGVRKIPVSRLGAALLPWTWTGFAIMFISGSLLVWMEAGRLYENIFFRIKVIMLILAGLNVLLFHSTVYRRVTEWENEAVIPVRARMAGACSIFLWFCIMASGRAIGYTLNYAA
jgi:hypothetical protein